MKRPKLSLILPCYNESEHFIRSAENILKVIQDNFKDYEVIFVEDKSTDSTYTQIQDFIGKHKKLNLKVIQHEKNRGRGKTVADGILSSRGKYVGFIDIDCEISPSYIPEFIAKLEEGYDIVCGHRQYKISLSGIVRAIASKLYVQLVQIILSTKLKDTEAGYKFFRRDKILSVLNKVRDTGWFWDTEIMIRAERVDQKITFISVLFNRRKDKTSTVNLLKDTLIYLQKLLQLRKELFI